MPKKAGAKLISRKKKKGKDRVSGRRYQLARAINLPMVFFRGRRQKKKIHLSLFILPPPYLEGEPSL